MGKNGAYKVNNRSVWFQTNVRHTFVYIDLLKPSTIAGQILYTQ